MKKYFILGCIYLLLLVTACCGDNEVFEDGTSDTQNTHLVVFEATTGSEQETTNILNSLDGLANDQRISRGGFNEMGVSIQGSIPCSDDGGI